MAPNFVIRGMEPSHMRGMSRGPRGPGRGRPRGPGMQRPYQQRPYGTQPLLKNRSTYDVALWNARTHAHANVFHARTLSRLHARPDADADAGSNARSDGTHGPNGRNSNGRNANGNDSTDVATDAATIYAAANDASSTTFATAEFN